MPTAPLRLITPHTFIICNKCGRRIAISRNTQSYKQLIHHMTCEVYPDAQESVPSMGVWGTSCSGFSSPAAVWPRPDSVIATLTASLRNIRQ